MNKHFIYDPGVNCALFDSQFTRWCAPEKIDCNIPNVVLVVPEGEQYHCSECCDGERIDYPIPFLIGDVIDLQTQIIDRYNPEPSVPVDGFGTWIIAEIINGSTGLVIGNYTTFGSGFVAWNGHNSYQLIRLDTNTGSFPDCFYVRYKVYKPGVPDVLVSTFVSQTFKKTIEQNTMLLEGIYTKFDCRNQFYGESENSVGDVPFEYSNQLRFIAIIKDIEPTIEKTIKKNITISTTVTDRQQIDFIYPMPAFMVNYVSELILSSNDIRLNGAIIKEVVSIEAEKIEETCSYFLKVIINKVCQVNQC